MTTIWHRTPTAEELNQLCADSLAGYLAIDFIEVGDDYLVAQMPVNDKTKQPYGLLHGGASCVLAETLGSVAANFTINREHNHCVGLEINANHLRPVTSGLVTGIVKSLHIGRKTQVWDIKIYNEQKNLSCVSRLTVAVIDKLKLK